MSSKERISIGPRNFGDGSLTIKNLTEEEMKNIEGMVHNHFWTTVGDDGRLSVIRKREQVPSPVDDEEMMPFWRRPVTGEMQLQLFPVRIANQLTSINIQHLCGYNYSPENYRTQAECLESYGFECLRSRRGDDGRFMEIWVLPSIYFAKGELKEKLEGKQHNEKRAVDIAVKFLCHNVQFGTLDLTFQRAAMPPPD